jgi:hypothetical protein
MKDILGEAGIEVTPQNKKAVDQAFHQIVDVEYKNCSPTWKKIKADFISDPSKKQQLIGKLKESME